MWLPDEGIDPMRVVVVDDDGPMLRTHGRVLRAHGWRPVLMPDPVEALQEIVARPPPVVILDLVMPVMSGLELTSRLRSALGSLAPSLILVSAHASQLTPHEAAHFDAVHPKPYVIERLVKDLYTCSRRYLERWRAASEVRAREGRDPAGEENAD